MQYRHVRDAEMVHIHDLLPSGDSRLGIRYVCKKPWVLIAKWQMERQYFWGLNTGPRFQKSCEQRHMMYGPNKCIRVG